MQQSQGQPIPVADVMTRDVCTAESSRSLREIRGIFAEQKCHHLPIVEENKVVGMVSAHDMIVVVTDDGADDGSAEMLADGSARDVMSTDLQTIHMLDTVEQAIERIGRGDIHSLIVLDDDGLLVGIVTHRDLLHYLTR